LRGAPVRWISVLTLPLFRLRQYDERMSFSETIFLFFLALIIFGPKKLPEIARQVGKALNEFRRASNEFKAQIEQEISHLEDESAHKILPPSPPPEGVVGSGNLKSGEPGDATLAGPVASPVPETAISADLTADSQPKIDNTSAETVSETVSETTREAAPVESSPVADASVTAASPQGSHV